MDRVARVALVAAGGEGSRVIARRLCVRPSTVSEWRSRFAWEGLAGRLDQPRAGRPNVFGLEVEVRPSGMPRRPSHLFVQALNPLQQDLEASRSVLPWKKPS